MSKSVEELFKDAPEGATHWDASDCRINSFMKFDRGQWFYWPPASAEPHWCRWGSVISHNVSDMIERPVQPKPWSGPEDGLPPVGLECEVDHGNGKHWDKVTIVAHHCEKAIYLDPVREIHYIWGLVKDFRTIRTPDQIASEQRETAIRELMDIAQVDCRVTAARLVDAGFKREVV